ncbi:MAG: hypothetical protein ACRELX_12175, partial [Longimicrobiales bacterium]
MTVRFASFAGFIFMAGIAAPLQAQSTEAERAARRAEAQRAFEREMAAERRMAGVNSVWLEELTWMEIR